jgi:hypothetical protein
MEVLDPDPGFAHHGLAEIESASRPVAVRHAGRPSSGVAPQTKLGKVFELK